MNIFLTIWNRHTWAIQLCEDFAKAGLTPILIDNNSDYPPCVKWLSKCPYKVHHMNDNYSAWAFFVTDLYQQYRDQHFFISDSDMSIEGIPSDWVQKLVTGLELHTEDNIWKSGLSQRIDDLPDNPYANEIKEYEKNFYTNLTEHGYYKVWLDLGVAVYDRARRGECPNKEENWYSAVRSPLPYASRHLDWSLTPETMRPEDIYYLTNTNRRQDGWLCLWQRKYNYKP